MFGGKLAAKKKLEFSEETTRLDKSIRDESGIEIDYKLQQLMCGGPVQRALKADLVSLKNEFWKDLALQDVNTKSGKVVLEKAGAVFKVFKATYHRTRFGIIHSRACPPRCDNILYVQMIYSAVLDLMPNYMSQSGGNETTNSQSYGDISDRLFDGIFVIFALYTIHATNPLPRVPIRRRIGQTSPDDTQDSDRYYLSAMPMAMGTACDQGGKRAFRKSYVNPIRIDSLRYSALFRIRNLALATLDSSVDAISMTNTSAMARDCIHVIDRLKISLMMSEFSGPGSLEGLIGSEDYYHSVALKQKRNKTETETEPQLGAVLNNVDWETNTVALIDAVDLSDFRESFMADLRLYNDITGNIAMNLARNNTSARPSRQLQSVQETLDPLIKLRTHQTQRALQFVERFKASLLGELDGLNIFTTDANEQTDEEVSLLVGARSSQNVASSRPQTHKSIRVSFQASLSNGVKKGIEKALQEIIEKVAKKSATNNANGIRRHRLRTIRDEAKIAGRDDWLFDDCFDDIDNDSCTLDADASFDTGVSVEEESRLDGIDALENLISQARKPATRRPTRKSARDRPLRKEKYVARNDSSDSDESHSDSDESHDSRSIDAGGLALKSLLASAHSKTALTYSRSTRSVHSMSTTSVPGPGQNALTTLLNQLKQPRTRKRVIAKKAIHDPKKKVKQTRTLSSTRPAVTTNKGMANKFDDKSVFSRATFSTDGALDRTEPGQLALQSLLKKAVRNESSSDGDDGSSEEESISTAGPGNNALAKLLSFI